MSSWGSPYTQCYRLHGDGDIAAATAIQARLRDHGMCSYFNWDPKPPRWRFFYETNLSFDELSDVLSSLAQRFNVTIEE